jgi:hypothetical protein
VSLLVVQYVLARVGWLEYDWGGLRLCCDVPEFRSLGAELIRLRGKARVRAQL